MKAILGVSFAVLLGAAVSAQTFVVDVANGPGTTWTSLATAAAAAPDGATLLVRPGSYSGTVDIAGKGLAILADAGVEIVAGGIRVSNTQPGQTNVLRGLGIHDWNGFVWVTNCTGLVVFERLDSRPWSAPFGGRSGLTVSGSTQVAVRDSIIWAPAVLASQVVFEGSLLAGLAARAIGGLQGIQFPTPALEVTGGSVQIVDCVLPGGTGDCGIFTCPPGVSPPSPFQNEPAIRLNGGSVTVRAPATLTGGSNGVQADAIAGTGVVRLDPAVVLAGAVAVTPPPQVQPLPVVRSASTAPGGAMTAQANGPAGDLLLLVVGLPGPEGFVPGIIDPFWMDPAAHVFAAIGVAAPPQPLTASVAIPNQPFLRGARLAWQAVSYGAATGRQASQPSIAIVF